MCCKFDFASHLQNKGKVMAQKQHNIRQAVELGLAFKFGCRVRREALSCKGLIKSPANES